MGSKTLVPRTLLTKLKKLPREERKSLLEQLEQEAELYEKQDAVRYYSGFGLELFLVGYDKERRTFDKSKVYEFSSRRFSKDDIEFLRKCGVEWKVEGVKSEASPVWFCISDSLVRPCGESARKVGSK